MDASIKNGIWSRKYTRVRHKGVASLSALASSSLLSVMFAIQFRTGCLQRKLQFTNTVKQACTAATECFRPTSRRKRYIRYVDVDMAAQDDNTHTHPNLVDTKISLSDI